MNMASADSVRASRRWFTLEIVIDKELEDTISSTLWEYGTLGIFTSAESASTVTLSAYFDNQPDTNEWQARLADTAAQFGFDAQGIRAVTLAEVPDEDWLKKWKE